jgi:S1-C subfamily serine protease
LLDHSASAPHFRRVPKKLFCVFLLAALAMTVRSAEPERSVIQIMTFSQQPDWDAPWRFDPVRRSSGSGFFIKGKRIMTNAHVVSWARQILVHRYQDPRPYLAHVKFVAHDCDLALLEVEDEGFFNGLEPLRFGDLPPVRSTVVTCGYPAGGEQISYTRGVVSRVELQNYAHSGNRAFLTVQTDAAINPGNSGGPVLQDDLVVGVAFQGMPGLENTGFFIPPPVIQHFLKDIEDGRYGGFPMAGIRVVPLQNPAYRRYLKLPDNDSGARVDSLLPIAATEKLIQPDDVLMRVGKYDVASDGTVLYEANRVSASAAFQTAQRGESLPLRIWRQGKETEISLPMNVYDGDRSVGNQYDVLPRYFVYAGLVFTPLSLDYMKTLGQGWRDSANAELIYELYYRRNETPDSARFEPIVLASTLAHPVNANFKISHHALVDKINGVRINRLEDVVRAFESATNTHHVIEFVPNHAFETLNRAGAETAQAEILKTYSIPRDRRL